MSERAGRVGAAAPAKVNLCLRVLGRRGDGRHELDSLVAFAACADRLEAAPAAADSFTLDGPFASALEGQEANLVVRARDLLRAEVGLAPVRLHLTKTLPVAAGIGGGSADAGAALRVLSRLAGGPGEAVLARLAGALGADVPACLASRPAWMTGAGERLAPLAAFPGVPAVLANPGLALSTRDVFARLGARPLGPGEGDGEGAGAPARPAGFADRAALFAFLEGAANDLEAPARALAPVLSDVLAMLRAAPGARLARMSGSGATCFALFETDEAARAAAGAIAGARPAWWTAATRLLAAHETPDM